MSKFRNRRRLLKIAAAVAAIPLLGASAIRSPSSASTFTWRGRALGVEAEMNFRHHNPLLVKEIIDVCVSEIDRLESIFSLYRENSEINRLNRFGILTNPSPEMRTVMAEAVHMSIISRGAFDVTVQPLWQKQWERLPNNSFLKSGLIDYRNIQISESRISFAQTGMAITLNGIAQGFITDRIASLLHQYGFDQMLLQLGETHAAAPVMQPWRIALGDENGQKISLSSGAIATSGGDHLINPHTAKTPSHYTSVSIIADRAIVADALSTALFVTAPDQARNILRQSSTKLAIFQFADGSTKTIKNTSAA